jgi:hypothetical protein
MEMDEDYFNIAETRINAYEEYRELLKWFGDYLDQDQYLF